MRARAVVVGIALGVLAAALGFAAPAGAQDPVYPPSNQCGVQLSASAVRADQSFTVTGTQADPAELVTIKRFGLVDFEPLGDRVSGAWLNEGTYLSSHAVCGVAWPDKDYVQVRFDRDGQPPPTASPTEKVNLLDPRAKRPKGCFENTGEL